MSIKISKKKLDKSDEIAIHHGFEFVKVPSRKTTKNPYLVTEEKDQVIKTFKKIIAKNKQSSPAMVYFDQPVLVNKKKNINSRTHKVLNLDIIGIPTSVAEAMIINTSTKILQEEGYKNIFVDINCTGDRDSLGKFMPELLNHYKKNSNTIDCKCKNVTIKKALALLNCDHKTCQPVRENAPRPISYLSDQSQKHFKEVLEYLEEMNIPYRINNELITENNHYSKTIFEIKDAEEEKTLALGGRYDDMANKIANKRNLMAVGVSMKFRKLNNTKAYSNKIKIPQIYLIQFGFQAKLRSLEIIDTLRKQKITVHQSLYENRLSDQFETAKKMRVPYMIIVGQKEALDGEVIFRNMKTVSHDVVKINKLTQYLKRMKII